jgi:hypothetical protein
VVGEVLHRPVGTARRCVPRVSSDSLQPLLVLVGRTFEKGEAFDPRNGTAGVFDAATSPMTAGSRRRGARTR